MKEEKRFILKKSIVFTSILLGSLVSTSVLANDLKRSCIKENPLVEGETDRTLIHIYTQVCDKKNKENKNAYLVQAAQQFENIGRSLKALQLVNELNVQGFGHTILTDVKFSASVNIANQALEQIRSHEGRYIDEDLYPDADSFANAVKAARPLPVIQQQVEEEVARSPSKSNNNVRRTPTKQPASIKSKTPTRVTTPQKSSNTTSGRKNPFDVLQ
jgi:hypothetical protein